MLDSLVRVSRRVGWITDPLHAARGLPNCFVGLLAVTVTLARGTAAGHHPDDKIRATNPARPWGSEVTGRGDLLEGEVSPPTLR